MDKCLSEISTRTLSSIKDSSKVELSMVLAQFLTKVESNMLDNSPMDAGKVVGVCIITERPKLRSGMKTPLLELFDDEYILLICLFKYFYN